MLGAIAAIFIAIGIFAVAAFFLIPRRATRPPPLPASIKKLPPVPDWLGIAATIAAALFLMVMLNGEGGTFSAIIFVAVSGFFYVVPTLVAYRRHHRQVRAIAVLNLGLGWTFLGWVVALVWANTADTENDTKHQATMID